MCSKSQPRGVGLGATRFRTPSSQPAQPRLSVALAKDPPQPDRTNKTSHHHDDPGECGGSDNTENHIDQRSKERIQVTVCGRLFSF